MTSDDAPSARTSRPRGAPRLLVIAYVVALFAAGVGTAWMLDHAPASERVVGERDLAPTSDASGSTFARGGFSVQRITISMNEEARSGFLVGRDIAPGQVVRGTLRLDSSSPVPSSDFAFTLRVTGSLAGHREDGPRLDELLHVQSLRYADQELIRGRARDLIAEIDATRGDGDGRLSLRELASGAIALPAPLTRGQGGSALSIEVLFDPDVDGDGSELQAQELDLAFAFTLADSRPDVPPPPPVTAPDAPAAPRAASRDGLVMLSWSPPANNGGAAVTSYRVYRGADALRVAEVARVSGTAWTDESVERGQTYHYRVAASNTAGTSPMSEATHITVPLRPTSSLATQPVAADGIGGWWKTAPTITFSAAPAGSSVRYALDGDADVPYGAPFTLPTRETTLTWRAVHPAAGEEAPRTETFLIDAAAPVISDLVVSARELSLGQRATVTVHVADAGSGVASVDTVLRDASGSESVHRMMRSDDTFTVSFAPVRVGDAALVVRAFDVAGHAASFQAGALRVLPAGPEPTGESGGEAGGEGSLGGAPEGGSGAPGGGLGGGQGLEPTSGGSPGGSGPSNGNGGPGGIEESRASPTPQIILVPEESGMPARAADGVSGDVRVQLTGARDPSRVVIVLIAPDGTETILGHGNDEIDWQTSAHENGYYRIESREENDDGSYDVVSSLWVLVFNPRATPGSTATGMVVGVATAVAASTATSALSSGALSTAGSALGARSFDFLNLLREAVGAVGEDKVRERMTGRAVARRFVLPSLAAAVIAVTMLALFFTWEGVSGWDVREYVTTLPVVGLAALAFFSVAYGAELMLAQASGARTKFRFLISGTIALAISGVFLRQCFGYAGYVQKDDLGDDEAAPQRRLKAVRSMAVFGLVLATTLGFLLAGWLWRFDFAEWGITIALTALATSSMPLRPLPGYEVWRWNKAAAIVTTLSAFALFFLFEVAWLPASVLMILGSVGGLGFALGWWGLRRGGAFHGIEDEHHDVAPAA